MSINYNISLSLISVSIVRAKLMWQIAHMHNVTNKETKKRNKVDDEHFKRAYVACLIDVSDSPLV